MRKLVAVLSVALVATAVAAIWMWRELREERERNHALITQVQQLDTTPLAATPVAAPPSGKPVSVSTASAEDLSKTAAPPAASETVRVVQGTQEDWMAYQRRLMSDPKYRDAWRAQQRLKYSLRRENTIRLLDFTPEQADAAIELALEQELRMQQRGIKGPSSAEQAQADGRLYRAQVRELLGDAKFERWEEYMASRPSRMQVDQLRTQLTGADPLRDDQVEPLIAVLHVENARLQQELQEYRETLHWEGDASESSRRLYEKQAELAKIAYGRMRTSATGILSPAQLSRLDAMLQHNLEQMQAQTTLTRIRSKLDAGGEPVARTD